MATQSLSTDDVLHQIFDDADDADDQQVEL